MIFNGAGVGSSTEIAAEICPSPGPSLSGNPPEVDPEILDILATMPPGHLVQDVLLMVESTVAAPALPRFDPTQPRSSRDNVAIANARSRLFATFRRDRLVEQQWLADKIANEDGRVMRQTTLGSLMKADVTVATLLDLKEDVRLASIGSGTIGAVSAPVSGVAGRSLLDARQQIGADTLHFWGYNGQPYYIGVVDTGIRDDHDLLVGKVASNLDCTQNVGGACSGSDPADCSLGGDGHGTAAAAITAANNVYGIDDRGYSDGLIHGWKAASVVFGGVCSVLADHMAVALDNAVLADDVVTISLATLPDVPPTAISQFEGSVNEAYATGATIISAVGNWNTEEYPIPNIGAPGSAENTIAVGAVKEDGSLWEDSSVGPAVDGRMKPDILAPTDIFTACSSSTDCGGTFSGTSAATPNAAGAATQLLDLYNKAGGADSPSSVVPGRIYASLIAFGSPLNGSAAGPNDAEGSGLLRLGEPFCSRWRWGSATVSASEPATTQMQLNFGGENVRVGIWWSDNPGGVPFLDFGHAAMKIVLEGPGTAYVTGSATPDSTFQRLIVPSLGYGTWTMKIEWGGAAPSAGTQRLVHFLWYVEAPAIECTQSG